MRFSAVFLAVCTILAIAPLSVSAQGTGLTFSGLNAVRGLPVEISADSLDVDNSTGESLFSGNAVLAQGDMRLAAPRIRIIYDASGDGRIQRLEASGGVMLVTAQEEAEAQTAEYEVIAGVVRMRGSVMLTQGRNVLTGDRLDVNLQTGQGRMDGNVRTRIQTNP